MAYTEKRDEVKELREKIATEPDGAYLFWGEEEYLKHYYLGELRTIIEKEGMTEFNRTEVDFLRDGTMNELEEAVDMPPMMADHKIVEVWGLDINGLKAEDQKRLIQAIKKVELGTILVIFARSTELEFPNKKSREKKIIKDLQENLTMVEFPRQTKQRLTIWLDKQFNSAEVRVSDFNIDKMIELCDFSMTRLKNEADKLIAYCRFNGISSVPNEIVEQFVKPCAENEVWDLTDAVINKSKKEAMAMLENLRGQNIEAIPIVSAIGKAVNALAIIKSAKGNMTDQELNKLADLKGDWQVKRYRQSLYRWSEAELKRAVELIFKCEGELKSLRMPEYVLLEALVAALP